MSSDKAPSWPKHIGKYEIGDELGCGSFSHVCLAQDIETHTIYAVKIVPKANLANQQDEQRFQREINTMAFLKNPNLVALNDFFWDDENFYMIIDYCQGGELFDYIVKNERLDEQTASIVFHQILLAIECCHLHGVAHRDLKPENVLITEFPHVKVADFGLCGLIKEETKMKTFCGSPCYCAPECLCRVQYDGKKADIWSMGIMLYAMVTGEHPWDITNTSMMLRQILKASYYVPEFLSPEVVDLISRILKPQPAERITIEEIKEHPWVKRYFPNKHSIKPSKSMPNNRLLTLEEFTQQTCQHASIIEHGICNPIEKLPSVKSAVILNKPKGIRPGASMTSVRYKFGKTSRTPVIPLPNQKKKASDLIRK